MYSIKDMDRYLPPNKFLSIRTIAMPENTNPHGDIFAGWLTSQMDLAASNVASNHCRGRVVTVSIENISFHKPVFVGDEISCYAEIHRIGHTSLTVNVDVWSKRSLSDDIIHIAQGGFILVSIDKNYTPQEITLHKTEEQREQMVRYAPAV